MQTISTQSNNCHLKSFLILDPSGERVKVGIVEDRAEGGYLVEFTPRTVGNHLINVDYAGEPVTGSPFTTKAYDSGCARLYPVEEDAVVGRPANFLSNFVCLNFKSGFLELFFSPFLRCLICSDLS